MPARSPLASLAPMKPLTKAQFKACRAFAALSPAEKLAIVERLSDDEAAVLQYTWAAWARDKQLDGMDAGEDWTHWVLLAGRGFGKTRVGAEWIRMWAESGKVARMILVARTAADVRDTMVEGESGLLAVSPPWFKPEYQPSKRRIVWPNGCMAITFSAEEPDSLRGPQCEKCWCDERASWQYDEAWDNLMMGMRLGRRPQCIITTTPRATKAIKYLKAAATSKVTIGNTRENRENLAPAFLTEVIRRYEGTRIGRQELDAEILEDIDGALWKRDWIEATRVVKPPEMKRIVVAIDPPAASDLTSDDPAEAGILVVGLGIDNHGYVLADYSLVGTPNEWASAALVAYNLFEADVIVGEVNNGGEMVEAVIQGAARERGMKRVPFKAVRATRGKQLRAEPVSNLYQQQQIHHVGTFPTLEDQQCNWLPGDKSPDRLDANVWGITEILIGDTVPASDHIDALKERLRAQAATLAVPTPADTWREPVREKAFWE